MKRLRLTKWEQTLTFACDFLNAKFGEHAESVSDHRAHVDELENRFVECLHTLKPELDEMGISR